LIRFVDLYTLEQSVLYGVLETMPIFCIYAWLPFGPAARDIRWIGARTIKLKLPYYGHNYNTVSVFVVAT